MNRIKVLPPETIVKIAAGEIIEDPSSIIKELVENSIDAGATKIVINIENNGKDLIQVSDNGQGFNDEDLKIAFKRHSTSKIDELGDLDMSTTLGFRGEALSSIAYVSDLTAVTKRQDSNMGTKVVVDHSGEVIEKEEIVTNNGTTIIAKNLFDTIPVRDAYLKSRNYRITATNETVNRLALSRLDISFEYYRDNKLILRTDPKLGPINNIYSLLGQDIADNIHRIEYESKDFKIRGYISDNTLYRRSRKSQFLYVNDRSVSEKDITKTIESVYTSIIPLNRYPVYILYIDIDNKYLDINIHPKKDIVKFSNIDDIKYSISGAIKDKLQEILTVPSIKKDEKIDKTNETVFDEFPSSDVEPTNNLINVKDHTVSPIIDKEVVYQDVSEEEKYSAVQDSFVDTVSDSFDSTDEEETDPSIVILPNGYRYIGQFLEKYILLEDRVDKSIYFLDQHAAHERINYEKIKDEYQNSTVKSQMLLESFVIELSSDEFQYIISIEDDLEKLGIDIEDFGHNSIIIRSVPAYTENLKVSELIESIIANTDISKNLYELDPYYVMKKACTLSVKTGDHLSSKDVNNLIEELKQTDMPLTCPHGRPTLINITSKELDKEFNRI